MATKDVKVRVGVETTGAGDIQKLAQDVDRLAQETEAAAAASKTAGAAEAAAVAERRAAREALNAQRDALSLLRIENTGAARSTDAYRETERSLQLAIREASIAVRAKQAAVNDATAATRAAAAAEQALVAQADRAATAYRQAAAAATTAAREQQAAAGSVGTALQGIRAQLNAISGAVAIAFGGSQLAQVAGEVGRVADQYNNMAARVKLVGGNLEDVFAVAGRVGVEVGNVADLYVKIANAGRDFGVNQQQALQLTESISQALQLGGASAAEAASATLQLGQALASGVLQGDELRSILEASPPLARALADGLGVAVGQLKALGAEGALTTQRVVAALAGQSDAIKQQFEQLPQTIGRSLSNLTTQWTLYIGEVDKANGVSAAAASAINALAGNLDTLGSLLYAAGKAGAAYAAINLAKSFVATATAAAQATTATIANTAATQANAAAAATATASTSRWAGALSAIKGFALVTVLTNLESIATALGEQVAKWAGYGASIKKVDDLQRQEAESARQAATAAAALAQQHQQATDKALGLDAAARKVVDQFEGLTRKGESAADALAKVTKELQLGDITGIQRASAALDTLGQRGEISAEQIKRALAAALDGQDLARFEAQARAAFDGSEQGARRLAAALDAVADESLRRVGTSAEELKSGFSAAMTSAINDTDALAATLDKLGVKGDQAGRLLAKSLGSALDTATTVQAVQAVIDRLQALGDQGKITGTVLTTSMQAARAKLDDLVPGVTSLDEAFRVLGVKAPAELKRIADANKEAFDRIRNDGTVALTAKIEAFKVYADSAIAANGGVESSEIKLQRRMLEITADAAGLGAAFDAAMGRADKAIDRTRDRLGALGERLNQTAGSLSSGFEADTAARNASGSSGSTPTGTSGAGSSAPSGASGGYGTYLPEPSTDGPWKWVPALNQGYDFGGYWQNSKGTKYTGMATGPHGQNRPDFLGAPIGSLVQFDQTHNGPVAYQGEQLLGGGGGSVASSTAAAPAATGSTSHVVTIKIGSKATTINTASASDADALARLLQQLEDSSAAGG